LVQTGGIAGVHWTYSVKGQFVLILDPNAGAASFNQVDINATDDSAPQRSLDPNEVFNMTSLVGAAAGDGELAFTGKAADGSDVRITATVQDDRIHLVAQTTPPPNSADFFVFSMDAQAQRRYAGGTGEPNDPYQIATAAGLMALGETPEDYDKHFILCADIDLDPNLPGRKVFDRAVIAPDIDDLAGWLQGTPFTGVLDGKGHTISHPVIVGDSYLGLFGWSRDEAKVRNLGLVDVYLSASGDCVGGVIGSNGGSVTQCFCTGAIRGEGWVGGLVGTNGGSVTECYSTGTVSGDQTVGGLVGGNSSGGVDGWDGGIRNCYSTGAVDGNYDVGGLVGGGGGTVVACFWDTQTSGQTSSAGGTGKTTDQMQTAETFLDAGWDFMGETVNGPNDVWKIAEGLDYPRLWWEEHEGQVTLELGQVFAVTVESNPTTGYRWEWVDHQDSIVEQMGEAQIKPRETDNPPLVGAGGWETFTFKAVSPGQMTLKLVYRRPWEEGVEPLKTFLLHVTVPQAGLDSADRPNG